MRIAVAPPGALLAGGYFRSPLEDWPPSLWPNHGPSVRGVFAQVQGSRCRQGMGFSMVIVVSGEADACGPRDVQSRPRVTRANQSRQFVHRVSFHRTDLGEASHAGLSV
jgi:hypothetical protein